MFVFSVFRCELQDLGEGDGKTQAPTSKLAFSKKNACLEGDLQKFQDKSIQGYEQPLVLTIDRALYRYRLLEIFGPRNVNVGCIVQNDGPNREIELQCPDQEINEGQKRKVAVRPSYGILNSLNWGHGVKLKSAYGGVSNHLKLALANATTR